MGVCERERTKHFTSELMVSDSDWFRRGREEVGFGWPKRILSVIFYFSKESLSICCVILIRDTRREKVRMQI